MAAHTGRMRNPAERAQQQQRQQQACGNAGVVPRESACSKAEPQSRQRQKDDDECELGVISNEAVDFPPARNEPPQRAPRQHQRCDRMLPRPQRRRVSIEQPCRDQPRAGDQRGADECAVQEWSRHRLCRSDEVDRAHRERNAGRDLQQETEDPRREAFLPNADPYDRRAFERPRRRRPACVEGKGNGKRRKHNPEREE